MYIVNSGHYAFIKYLRRYSRHVMENLTHISLKYFTSLNIYKGLFNIQWELRKLWHSALGLSTNKTDQIEQKFELPNNQKNVLFATSFNVTFQFGSAW